jgi:hypothetical protein
MGSVDRLIRSLRRVRLRMERKIRRRVINWGE